MQDLSTRGRPVPLRPPRRRRVLIRLARGFVRLREEYDLAWELFEAAITAAIFVLLFLGLSEQEEFAGLLSHALVALLLAIKFASLGLLFWFRRHPPGLGID
jgi:hypothetical protein